MSVPELRLASEEEMAGCMEVGPQIVATLMQFQPDVAMTVLVYAVTVTVMGLVPRQGRTRTEAVKYWCEAVIKSIEAAEAIDRGSLQ